MHVYSLQNEGEKNNFVLNFVYTLHEKWLFKYELIKFDDFFARENIYDNNNYLKLR